METPGISHEWRNAFHNFLVFVRFFLAAQFTSSCNEPLNLGIFGNQGWIGRLSINKPHQAFDSESFIGIATVN